MRALSTTLLITAALSSPVATAQSYLNSYSSGNNVITRGSIYGQPYNSSTLRSGIQSHTTGSYGGQSFRANRHRAGHLQFDSYSFGNSRLNCTTQYLGSQTRTNCR